MLQLPETGKGRDGHLLEHFQECVSPRFLLFVRKTPESRRHEVSTGHLRHDGVGDVTPWERAIGSLRLALMM